MIISDNVPLSCGSMIDEVSIALYWIIYLSKVGLAILFLLKLQAMFPIIWCTVIID
jgi:hypothetical protein